MTTLIHPSCPIAGPPTVSGLLVCTEIDLSGEVQYTDPINVKGWHLFNPRIDWDKGDEDGVIARVEGSNDGSTWHPCGRIGAQVAGVSAATKDLIELNDADFDDPDKLALANYDIRTFALVRVGVEADGGSSRGSVVVSSSVALTGVAV